MSVGWTCVPKQHLIYLIIEGSILASILVKKKKEKIYNMGGRKFSFHSFLFAVQNPSKCDLINAFEELLT